MCEEKCGNAKGLFTKLVEDSEPSKLAQERLLSLFSYDEEAGELVRILTTSNHSKNGKVNKKSGVIRVGIDNEVYTAHYLMWRIFYGREPINGVFHKDWDMSNNKIDNLVEGKRPMNPKHVAEAVGTGFTLVNDDPLVKDDVADFNYKTYSCDVCGLEQLMQPTHIRRKNCKCLRCNNKLLAERAKAVGFTLIADYPEDVSFKVYQRDLCGHVYPIRHSSMIKRTGVEFDHACDECYTQKLKRDAEKVGMTYLGAAHTKKSIFRRYLFNQCGHERDVNAACVARGAAQCQDCELVKRQKEAEDVGLVYLDSQGDRVGITAKHRYILPCGCTKSIRIDHAKRNIWQCHNCGDTHYTKPSSVYLLHIVADDFEWLKLGYAKDIKARATGYGLNGKPYTVVFERDFKTGVEALQYEQTIHSMFKSHKLNKKDMKRFQKFNGHTECYPVGMLDTILSRLKEDVKLNEEESND